MVDQIGVASMLKEALNLRSAVPRLRGAVAATTAATAVAVAVAVDLSRERMTKDCGHDKKLLPRGHASPCHHSREDSPA